MQPHTACGWTVSRTGDGVECALSGSPPAYRLSRIFHHTTVL